MQISAAAAAAKSLQSCPTLCDPRDGSPPGSPVPGILQAWTLEWVAISFSNAWKRKVKVKSLSRVRLLATPWTGAYQAPPSMGFSRQEYWSGVPLPSLIQQLLLTNCYIWYWWGNCEQDTPPTFKEATTRRNRQLSKERPTERRVLRLSENLEPSRVKEG